MPVAPELPALVTPYERLLMETVDDLELFAFWHETQRQDVHGWARLLPEDLGVRLFDAGWRSVARIASTAKTDAVADLEAAEGLRDLVGGEHGFTPPLWFRLVEAARAWEPWPRPYKEALALRFGLRLPETVSA